MSETTRGSHNQATQQVSSARLQELKAAARTAERIKAGVLPTHGSHDRAVVAEIRDIERRASLDSGRATETRIDVRGYTPMRYNVTFVDNGGDSIDQEVVMFAKQDRAGQWEWLRPEGESGSALALNAQFYDARLESHIHKMYYGFDTTTMVSVGSQGELSGIYTIYEDKRQQS